MSGSTQKITVLVHEHEHENVDDHDQVNVMVNVFVFVILNVIDYAVSFVVRRPNKKFLQWSCICILFLCFVDQTVASPPCGQVCTGRYIFRANFLSWWAYALITKVILLCFFLRNHKKIELIIICILAGIFSMFVVLAAQQSHFLILETVGLTDPNCYYGWNLEYFEYAKFWKFRRSDASFGALLVFFLTIVTEALVLLYLPGIQKDKEKKCSQMKSAFIVVVANLPMVVGLFLFGLTEALYLLGRPCQM